MSVLTKPPKNYDRLCWNCKHNCIKMIMLNFETGDPCTGVCNNPKNDIYYNNVDFTCEDWEAKYSMKFKVGDALCVCIDGEYRCARVVAVHDHSNKYTVTIDHGNGGFHKVGASDVFDMTEIDPSVIKHIENRVPSWHEYSGGGN